MTKQYTSITAFESALKAKLANTASADRPLQYLRKQVAFDRVLARLWSAAPEAWLLKGGVALEYRLQRARATKDVDVATHLDPERMSAALHAATMVELDDYFQLRIGERERPVPEVQTFRFDITVEFVNGKSFERLKLDVGIADSLAPDADMISGPDLLGFAGIAPATVRVLPIELHLAEKLHAYTKRYGAGGSTRVKDLVDMALLIDQAIDNQELSATIRRTFESRGTHAIPMRLPAPPRDWRVPYATLAKGLPIDESLVRSHSVIAAFLDPVLATLTT